jgi:non-homologous end joining protein Ku
LFSFHHEGHAGSGQAHRRAKSAHFDPSKFEDHYEAALQELLDKKQKGQPIAKMAPRTSAKVVNLMDALLRASPECGVRAALACV